MQHSNNLLTSTCWGGNQVILVHGDQQLEFIVLIKFNFRNMSLGFSFDFSWRQAGWLDEGSSTSSEHNRNGRGSVLIWVGIGKKVAQSSYESAVPSRNRRISRSWRLYCQPIPNKTILSSRMTMQPLIELIISGKLFWTTEWTLCHGQADPQTNYNNNYLLLSMLGMKFVISYEHSPTILIELADSFTKWNNVLRGAHWIVCATQCQKVQ